MALVRRILLPTDFSEASYSAFPVAERLARLHGAELILYHCVPPLPWPADLAMRERTPNLVSVLEGECRERLEALRAERLGADLDCRVHVDTGSPAIELVQFAADNAVDVVVIATRGQSGLKRFLLGSTTERVARSAPCSVYAVRG